MTSSVDASSGYGYLGMFLSEMLPTSKVSKITLVDKSWPVEIPSLRNRETAREHWWRTPSVFSRGGTLLPSIYADARYVC